MKAKKTAVTFVLLTVLALAAHAQQYDPESDFEVTPMADGKSVAITKYVGSKRTISIPPTIQGLSVTHIGDRVFNRKNLTSVTIPNSVTSIGGAAFYMNQLTSVTIPNSVTSIGVGAFRSNLLTNVAIPDSVTSIGDWAFDGNRLTSVTIANSVTTIGYAAFSDNRLTSITIPNSVTSIGTLAFGGNRLTSVTIGAKVKIESNSFSKEFFDFYNAQGQRAGTYTFSDGKWSVK